MPLFCACVRARVAHTSSQASQTNAGARTTEGGLLLLLLLAFPPSWPREETPFGHQKIWRLKYRFRIQRGQSTWFQYEETSQIECREPLFVEGSARSSDCGKSGRQGSLAIFFLKYFYMILQKKETCKFICLQCSSEVSNQSFRYRILLNKYYYWSDVWDNHRPAHPRNPCRPQSFHVTAGALNCVHMAFVKTATLLLKLLSRD